MSISDATPNESTTQPGHGDDVGAPGPGSPDVYPGLDEEFSDYLRARAVPREIAIERGYEVVRQGKPLDGSYAASWGFVRKAAGLLMPLHGVLDDDPRDSVQLRIHRALEPVFTKPNGKAQRFLTPRGQRNVLATAPRTRPLLETDQIRFAPKVVQP